MKKTPLFVLPKEQNSACWFLAPVRLITVIAIRRERRHVLDRDAGTFSLPHVYDRIIPFSGPVLSSCWNFESHLRTCLFYMLFLLTEISKELFRPHGKVLGLWRSWDFWGMSHLFAHPCLRSCGLSLSVVELFSWIQNVFGRPPIRLGYDDNFSSVSVLEWKLLLHQVAGTNRTNSNVWPHVSGSQRKAWRRLCRKSLTEFSIITTSATGQLWKNWLKWLTVRTTTVCKSTVYQLTTAHSNQSVKCFSTYLKKVPLPLFNNCFIEPVRWLLNSSDSNALIFHMALFGAACVLKIALTTLMNFGSFL